MNKTAIILIVFLILVLGYCNLPFSMRYYSEIKMGEEYIKNINHFKDSTGFLPETSDWEKLVPLMPQGMESEWTPTYTKLDSLNFELIFVYGFDGPYPRYCSITNEWSYGFSCVE